MEWIGDQEATYVKEKSLEFFNMYILEEEAPPTTTAIIVKLLLFCMEQAEKEFQL